MCLMIRTILDEEDKVLYASNNVSTLIIGQDEPTIKLHT